MISKCFYWKSSFAQNYFLSAMICRCIQIPKNDMQSNTTSTEIEAYFTAYKL